ncbi:hypothetical protein GCM10010842_09720 [Deinococcus daejeonensis]|uniref:Uncharacterized protein n=1 Tax=Deinococcus daejeonensis TaxID=1007098 RepID=A0ABQ2IZJ3_9DEIO|nr:hypothetical protein GCM10010842_09720 [Deinococcus daejeonensis]
MAGQVRQGQRAGQAVQQDRHAGQAVRGTQRPHRTVHPARQVTRGHIGAKGLHGPQYRLASAPRGVHRRQRSVTAWLAAPRDLRY